MSLIDYALKGNLKHFDEKLNAVSKNTGISKTILYAKFIRCFLMIGSGYSDFLNYKLYSRTDDEIKEYVTIKTQDYFYEIVSPSEYKKTFTVKINFLNKFKKYINRDFFYKGSFEEFKQIMSKHDKLIYKPVSSLGGDRVHTIYPREIQDLQAYYNEIIDNDILLEEYVIQHPEIAKFAPNSVNTLRIMTFAYNGESSIICSMLRIGNGKADVDNFHQGGMGVLIDTETGVVISDKAINKDGELFEKHPITNVKFKGFQIPNWEKVKKMCLEAALVDEHIHCVGFDVAVTKEDCTFIEGNRRPGYDLPQELYDRGRKDMMRYCLDTINAKEGTNYKV